ncbi:MAG: hypothetical protein ABI318_02650 [Chthoniobacteraceae bacterium]
MIYPNWLTLKLTMLAVGGVLLAVHLLALVKARAVREWLRNFPRSREAGVVLSLVAGGWFFFMVQKMDLGDFDPWRTTVQIATPIAAALAIIFIPDFLAVRALGTCALLIAEPLLESTFLRPESFRLVLVVLAYAWIVFGMFWVGMPYTLRDQIAWVSASEKRWRAAAFAGLAYGALLVAGGLLVR